MRITKKSAAIAWLTTVSAVAVIGAAGGPATASSLDSKDDSGAAQPQTVPARLAPDRRADAQIVTSAASEAALAKVQKRIATYVSKQGTKYSFGSYADPATGDIVLETNAPTRLVDRLTRLDNITAAVGARGFQDLDVTVRRATPRDTWHRNDDIAPFYGGGGLRAGTAFCTAGYTVKTASNTRFMVTAGHCYANDTAVNTASNLRPVGVVSNRLIGSVDMELLGGQSYAGRVFTGGVTSATSAPVVAAGSTVPGFANYCHSGMMTGEQCGHTATSATAQVCTQTGCKSPLIAFTGGATPQAGDSGAPFYAKDSGGGIWIRGHIIAGSGATGWAQPWSTVVANYGVSIVSG